MGIQFGQQSTKVKQLSDLIEQEILTGKYKTNTNLPSINNLSKTYKVSRDTVFKAFANLRERKLIDSTPGKGYYVINKQEKILFLLDEYSPFKNTLYNSFIKYLGKSYKVDLWFHQYNEHIFNTILHEAIGRYNYYVVMNFDNEKFSPLLNKIPTSRLLLLDFGKFEKKEYSFICQNFDTELYGALMHLKDDLKKYKRFEFLIPKASKHPSCSIDSIKNFCKAIDIECKINKEEELNNIEKNVVYLVIRQTDVVNVIKSSRSEGLVCGKDFGLIAYNDTPAYEVIDNGITALSINWEKMGEMAAQFVRQGETYQVFLPTEIHLRKSI